MNREPRAVVGRFDVANLNFKGERVGDLVGAGRVGSDFGELLAGGKTFRVPGIPGTSFRQSDPGLLKTNLRAHRMGKQRLPYRLFERTVGRLAQSQEKPSLRRLPFRATQNHESPSEALFDRKGAASVSPLGTSDGRVQDCMAPSTALRSKVNFGGP
jgi:hypothetical protein